MTAELFAPAFAVVNSLVIAAVSYGNLKSKIERLERDLESARDSMVTLKLLDAIVGPLKEDLSELKRDVRHLVETLEK